MPKQYIDYDRDNEDIIYSNEDLQDIVSTEESFEEKVIDNKKYNEDYLTDNDDLINAPKIMSNIKIKTEIDANPEAEEINNLVIDKQSSREYLDDDFEYKDDEVKPKAKKDKKKKKKNKIKKKSKILTYFLNFIYLMLRVFFLILFTLLVLNLKKYYSEINKESDIVTNESSNEVIVIDTENIDEEYIIYKNIVIDYILSLNEIIEGEKSCIANLSNEIISSKDAYNYFSKSLEKKDELLREFLVEEYPSELKALKNKVNQVFINSNNNSKSIMNRYLGSEDYSKMVSDMNNFITKHNQDILVLQEYLDKIK